MMSIHGWVTAGEYALQYPFWLTFLPHGKKMKQNAYSTKYYQAVTHPSSNAAQSCLTSVIGQKLVVATCYGNIM